MLHDQKVITLLSPMEKCPMAIYQRVVGPVTRDKKICHMIILS